MTDEGGRPVTDGERVAAWLEVKVDRKKLQIGSKRGNILLR